MESTSLIPPALPPASLPRLVKVRGWLLLLIGPFLCLAMGMVTCYLAVTIYQDSHHPSDVHWHGSHEMTVQAFSLFGAIFLLGLLSIANGLSLLRRGRLGPVLITLTVPTVLAIVWFTYQIIQGGHPA